MDTIPPHSRILDSAIVANVGSQSMGNIFSFSNGAQDLFAEVAAMVEGIAHSERVEPLNVEFTYIFMRECQSMARGISCDAPAPGEGQL